MRDIEQKATEDTLILSCSECGNDTFYLSGDNRCICTSCEADALNIVWDWTKEIEVYIGEDE